MNYTIRLLERVRAAVPPHSKNAVARAINADEANVRRYYKGKGFPNGLSQIQIAKILGIPLDDVIKYIAADKAKTEDGKKAAEALLPRILPTAGLTLACIVGGFITSGKAYAREEATFNNSEIMRTTKEVAVSPCGKYLLCA